MFLRKWDDLPEKMKNEQVRPYYDVLSKHRKSLIIKRGFDVIFSIIAIVIFLPVMAAVAVVIKMDSPGKVFFRQERITAYGKKFRIWKFRSMVYDAEKKGAAVTVDSDVRVTKVGAIIRKYRLDEIPQLFNILSGDMTFVGVRPEVEKYVNHYTDEMYATLLLPAGVTSEASIRYKDEYTLLADDENLDATYINKIMPGKMYYNLLAIKEFSIFEDLKTIFRTIFAVLGKEYADIRKDIVNGKNSRT